jgi:hypothetical protein
MKPTRVRVGKHVFPLRNDLKQGDRLSPLLSNFAVERAIKRVRINQDGSKLNGTQELLFYVYDVNILGGSVHAIKKNTETFLVRSTEIGLEVNANKTKYMIMLRDQNAGRSHNIKIDNSSLKGWNNSSIWEQP